MPREQMDAQRGRQAQLGDLEPGPGQHVRRPPLGRPRQRELPQRWLDRDLPGADGADHDVVGPVLESSRSLRREANGSGRALQQAWVSSRSFISCRRRRRCQPAARRNRSAHAPARSRRAQVHVRGSPRGRVVSADVGGCDRRAARIVAHEHLRADLQPAALLSGCRALEPPGRSHPPRPVARGARCAARRPPRCRRPRSSTGQRSAQGGTILAGRTGRQA